MRDDEPNRVDTNDVAVFLTNVGFISVYISQSSTLTSSCYNAYGSSACVSS